MSFAIVHMQKIKTGGIRGIENHNERLKESKTNPDINTEKSHLNQCLHGADDNRTYYNRVKDRIAELKLPKAVRKDAVTMCGFVCTSDSEYFSKLPQLEQERYFKESYEFLKQRYGEKNVMAAAVHYDEKTPHLHCYVVPVTEDGRLSAKDLFTRVELQQLQTDYHRHMNEKGFELERGLSFDGKRKHLDTQEFKIQTKQQELEKAKNELDKTQNSLKNDYEAIREVKHNVWALEHLEIKKSLIGAKITISEEDYNKLITMAKQGVYNSNKIRDLERENAMLKQDNRSYKEGVNRTVDRVSELKKENEALRKGFKDLKEQGTAMFETLKRHSLIPEAEALLKNIKQAEKASDRVLKKSRSFDMER